MQFGTVTVAEATLALLAGLGLLFMLGEFYEALKDYRYATTHETDDKPLIATMRLAKSITFLVILAVYCTAAYLGVRLPSSGAPLSPFGVVLYGGIYVSCICMIGLSIFFRYVRYKLVH